MRKTKRDIHKEIMYNKIMPTSYAKKNGDESAGTENSVSAMSFHEDADINDIIQSELPAVPNPADEQEIMESAEEIANKIDTENENIVKILSEYNEYKEKKSAMRKNKAEKILKKKELENARKKNSLDTESVISDEDEENVQNILNEIISKEGISEKISDNSKNNEKVSDENAEEIQETENSENNPSVAEEKNEQISDEMSDIEEISDDSDNEDYSDIFGEEEEIETEPEEVTNNSDEEEINAEYEEITDNSDEKEEIEIKSEEITDDSDEEENNTETEQDEDEMFGGSEEITEINNKEEKTEEKDNSEIELPEIKEEIKEIFPKIINAKEIIINSHIDEILDKFNCCKCTSCKLEITSNALNKLDPQYIIVNNEDEMNVDVTETDYSEITSALIHAIISIRANPIH